MSSAATFRPNLASLAGGCIGFCFSIYLFSAVLFSAFEESSVRWLARVSHYPFGFSFLIALSCCLVVYRGMRSLKGIRADDEGLTDLGTGLRLDWSEIERVEFETNHRGSDRVVSIFGASGSMHFTRSIWGIETPGRFVPPVYNLPEADALLAVIVARTDHRTAFPGSWLSTSETEPKEETATSASSAERAGDRRRWNGGGQGLGLLALLLKAIPKLLGSAAKLVKTIKPTAAALTLGSFGLVFSWDFAFALVGLILVHECGHVHAMWRCGVPVKGIYLIPFVGGAAVGRGIANTRRNNALIAISGPAWGGAFALICAAVYWFSGGRWPFLGTVAAWGALINLFNLLPVMPLDGGRLLANIAHSSGKSWSTPLVAGSIGVAAVVGYLGGLEIVVLAALIGIAEFAAHARARTIGGTLGLLPNRPLTVAEHEHFSLLVDSAGPNRKLDRRAAKTRRSGFELQLQLADQTPMAAKEAAAVAAAHALLAGALLLLLWLLNDIPGASEPLRFLA